MSDDEFRTGPVYPQARLRVTANYLATDGRIPETIDVEINDPDADLALLRDVITWLAAAPGNVETGMHIKIDPPPGTWTSASGARVQVLPGATAPCDCLAEAKEECA
jgi:hypothetical protein